MARPKTKSALILTARDLLKGYVAGMPSSQLYTLAPLQMIPEADKTEDWKRWNLDWLERMGNVQKSRDYRKLRQNYNMANGVLDPNDYIVGEANDMSDQVEVLAEQGRNTIPIRFYPVAPNIVSVMCGEFSKMSNDIIFKAVDQTSIDEVNQEKEDALTQILVQFAEQRKIQQLQEMGIDFGDEGQQDYIKQEIEASKSIVELHNKFKTYRGRVEQWANHMVELDNGRFQMYQLEAKGFRDMIVADREFWHVKLLEDDYKVEVWNPLDVFYHKSPDVEWISEGNYVGRQLLMSIPDVIDNFGDKLTKEQLDSLKEGYRSGNGMNIPIVDDAYKGWGDHYTDYSKPYPDNVVNTTMVQYYQNKAIERLQDPKRVSNSNNGDLGSWYDLKNGKVDYLDELNTPGMVRVTEAYWKSQKLYAELTKITKEGIRIVEIVDENFRVTEEPVYDESIRKAHTAENLISGEHAEWFWDIEVRGGVKINSLMSTPYTQNYSSFEPLYIGGDRIPFQFEKRRLPVEGRIFSERNSTSSGFIDRIKSFQINYNIVNNQIVDMLADNPGPALLIDQNSIPTNSMGQEWGKNNFAMLRQILTDYGVIPTDTSMRNQEGPASFSHFQMVDLSKTKMILGHLQLADYYKVQCFEAVGISPQRAGDVGKSESATGVQAASQASYNQTAPYFDQHMNHLMPRVREMMLDAAQFTAATKPRVREAYLNSDAENMQIDQEGPQLIGRRFQVYARSTADIKETVNKLQQLAMQNNTATTSLSDLAKMMSVKSPSEIISRLEEGEEKRRQETEAQRQHELQMQQEQQKFLADEKAREDQIRLKIESDRNNKDIYVAQIRASQSKENDTNADGIPDPLQALDMIHNQQYDAETLLNEKRKIDLDHQKHTDQLSENQKDRDIKREEMASEERQKAMDLKNPVVGEKKKK